MNRFIITSHGWSASNWIAHSLNLNKDIICTHSARNVLADDINLQSNLNLKNNINQLQKGYSIRQSRTLDTIYEEIEAMGYAKYYGSVHVLRIRDLPVIYKNHGISKDSFKVMNVVRNPIDLVWSGYGQFKDLFRYDINELHWTSGKIVNQALEFVNYIGKKYNLYIGDFENLSFIGACSILESLRLDIDGYSKIEKMKNIDFKGTFQMEDLTSNKEKFEELIKTINKGIDLSDNYIEKVFTTGIVNKHKQDSKKLTAFMRYEEFKPWQKEVFNYFFNLHDLKNQYECFGYDLSFIK